MNSLHDSNRRLNRIEYDLRHLHLYSRPRCLGIVLSNACNIDCVHCYQSKNGDNLLRPREIGGSCGVSSWRRQSTIVRAAHKVDTAWKRLTSDSPR